MWGYFNELIVQILSLRPDLVMAGPSVAVLRRQQFATVFQKRQQSRSSSFG